MGVLPILTLLLQAQEDPSTRARAWIAQLRSPRVEERREAARKLGEFRWREAVPEIVPLLREESWEMRGTALRALVQLRARSHAKEILPLLGDPDASVRELAVEAAAALGFREAIPRVTALLGDGSKYLRLAALRGLVRFQARDRAPEILGLLKDDRFPRSEVIRALCDLRAPGTARDLVRLLPGDGEEQGDRISRALCAMQVKEVVPDLLELLSHPEAGARQAAVDALAGLGAKEAEPRLVRLLLDRNYGVARSAAFALRTLRAEESVPHVVRLLEDRDRGAHRLAALALGGMGKESIPPLLKLLRSEDLSDQVVAMDSLAKLGAREAIPDLIRRVGTGGSLEGMYALPALVDLEAKESFPALLRLAFHHDAQVRYPARRALLVIDPGAAAVEGRMLLGHGGAGGRALGADLVGSAGSVDDVPALAPLVRDADAEVRHSAVRAIRALLPGEKTQAVLEDLERRHGPLKDDVLKAFAPPDAATIPLLRSLLPAADRAGRKRLGLELCRLGSREAVDDILEEAVEGGLDFEKLTPLNAVRSPEAWGRLQSRRLAKPLTGTREEVVEAIAREAGMTVEWPAKRLSEKFRVSVLDRESRRRRVPHLPGRPTLIEALDEALRDGHLLEAFLEPDRIRIRHRDDAVEEWVAWWAAEAARGK